MPAPVVHSEASDSKSYKKKMASLESTSIPVHEVRGKMKQFWQQYEPSAKSMMLCSAANDILASEDRSQILQTCPDLKGKCVLELGAGIGRFTTELAKIAKSVTAVDFIEAYVEENRITNGHLPHVKFLTADVTELEIAPKSFDVIFSNWLLMYLCDEEVEKLTVKMLSWLKEGGALFVRESCYRPSGDIKRDTNPTYYRSPLEYFRILQNSIFEDQRGQEYSFVCERALSIEAYIRVSSKLTSFALSFGRICILSESSFKSNSNLVINEMRKVFVAFF